MEVPREQAEKLKRYLINADPFLWGILEAKNKKERLKEIKALGFLQGYADGGYPNYLRFNQDLLIVLGVEGILERIVVPKVKHSFTPDVLSYFRRCWEEGQLPAIKYLKECKLYRSHLFAADNEYEGPRIVGHRDRAHIFFQIDTQHEFIERWTVFAGLWFEEIELLFNPRLQKR
jgi:hypothetical protein